MKNNCCEEDVDKRSQHGFLTKAHFQANAVWIRGRVEVRNWKLVPLKLSMFLGPL